MKNLLKLIVISLSFTVFPNDLLSIYEEALDKDPEFNSKKADLAISKEFLNQSRSGLMPQLRVTGGTNWNEYYQERELQNSYNTFSFGLNLSQPLFRLDKWFLNRQAKENLEAAEAQFAYQQQELIIKVTRAYFKVLSAKANLDAKVATEKALKNQYESVLERFNTGSVSRIDLADAKAALNRAESKLSFIKNLDFRFGNSIDLYKTIERPIDIIYLDPMYPILKKNQKKSLEIETIRFLLKEEKIKGSDQDIIKKFLEYDHKKIILKRPLKSEIYSNINYQVKGKTTRFDIYL